MSVCVIRRFAKSIILHAAQYAPLLRPTQRQIRSGTMATGADRCDQNQAASSRLISASNSNRSCAPSSSGSQFVICGKMVR